MFDPHTQNYFNGVYILCAIDTAAKRSLQELHPLSTVLNSESVLNGKRSAAVSSEASTAMQFEIIKNGYMECDKGFVTLGRNMGKTIKIPVYCYLVKHEKGNVLIDTGFSKEFEKTWGKRLAAFKPILEKDIPEYLKETKIDFIINTHLHLDHADNNDKFPGSRIICQKDEYALAKNPPAYQKFAYADTFPEGNYKLIEGNYDLFGDCKIHIIKTPGHTKGHQSVLLDFGNKKVFIAGDACYTKENLKYNCLPGFFWNADEVIKQYEYIKNLDAEIIYGHEELHE